MAKIERKKYWVMSVDDVKDWHQNAQEITAYTYEDAAERYFDYEGNHDDGDECDVVVSEYEDGRERKVFRVVAEVQISYDVVELSDDGIDFPDDPNAEPDDAPVRPVDKLTLPLFGE